MTAVVPSHRMEAQGFGRALAGGIGVDLLATIRACEAARAELDPTGVNRLDGRMTLHCRLDLHSRRVLEAAAVASPFSGYESLLPGKDLRMAGRVSALATGICGGVHATASALCLEMALGLVPPPLGVVLRNLLLSCQTLHDTCMHLFVLAGPDYSQDTMARTNPELWAAAQGARCRHRAVHGHSHIAGILVALNRGEGALYREAVAMTLQARRAYALIGGKYPNSDIIVPGGVATSVQLTTLVDLEAMLRTFAAYAYRTAAQWNDVFDFMLEQNPRYEDSGATAVSLLDFGQWDHPDFYDAGYATCDRWGERRWAAPGVMVDGVWRCGRLSQLNAGLEEHLDYSYRSPGEDPEHPPITHDPNGNPLSARHPWNRRAFVAKASRPEAYSWGSSLTWCGRAFEVGTPARLYLTALAGRLSEEFSGSQFMNATGQGLDLTLLLDKGRQADLQWRIPTRWNTLERNRARAYMLGFNLSVMQENLDLAKRYLACGEKRCVVPITATDVDGQRLGAGFWGASRGFLAHWTVLRDQVIDTYQVTVPSRVNMGTRTPEQEPGPLEKALLATPIIESQFSGAGDFSAIDLIRTIQSFDPCMSCEARLLVDGEASVLTKAVDTRFPV